MARKGASSCATYTTCRREKIEVIAHGIPDFPFLEPHHAKAKFGFGGKPSC